MVAAAANVEKPGNKGYQKNHMGQIFKAGMSFSGYERDGLFLNLEGGRFRDISGISGIDSITDGRGALFADFDNDGDLDVGVTTIQKTARLLFRNNVGQQNRSLRVTLVGTKSGRDAFGAVVRVKSSLGVQTKVKSGGSGFLSAHDPRLLFGLGAGVTIEWVEVVWPSGARQKYTGIAAGERVLIREGVETVERITETALNLVDPEDQDEAAQRSFTFGRGEPAPRFMMTTLSGERTELAKSLHAGRRTLVNFWATWCAPCRQEMKELAMMRDRLATAGVDLVGVSLDFGEAGRVRAFLAEQGIDYPIFIADQASMPALLTADDPGVPFSIVFDAQGRLEKALIGWSPRTRKEIEKLAQPAAPEDSSD